MNFEPQLRAWTAEIYDFIPISALECLQRPAQIQIVRIVVGHQVYWLRLYPKTEFSFEHIQDEAIAMKQLHQKGVKVAHPISRKDGEFVGSFQKYFVLMLANAEGIEVKTPTKDQARAFGALVATIHTAGHVSAVSRRPEIDYYWLAEQPLNAVEPYLAERKSTLQALRRIAQQMQTYIWQDGKETTLPGGFCHGDVHLENVHFIDTVPTIFDFEACATGPYAYDIACYWRKRILAHEDRSICYQEWDAFLQGYQTVRSLEPHELKVFPALATLRAIWTMALPALPSARGSTDWLSDLSYFDDHFKMIQDFSSRAHKIF